MLINLIGAFVRNYPFGTEIAFKRGLEEIGVEVRTFDPSRDGADEFAKLSRDADATIVFKHAPALGHVLKNCFSGKKIVYQPDDVRAPGIGDMLRETREYCDYAFTFDTRGASFAEHGCGYIRAKRLLVTACPSIYRPVRSEKSYDIVFVGSFSNPQMHASRRHMFDVLSRAGLYVGMTENVWDPYVINEHYNSARIVVNHATDVGQLFGYGYGYQCRHFEAGMAGTIVLSNQLIDEDEGGPQRFVRFQCEDSLVEAARSLLDKDDYVSKSLDYHNEIMAEHAPWHRAREIVDFVEGK